MKNLSEDTKNAIYFLIALPSVFLTIYFMSISPTFQKIVECIFWIVAAYFVLDALSQRDKEKKEEIKKEVMAEVIEQIENQVKPAIKSNSKPKKNRRKKNKRHL